jgi:hypothetical protein
MLADGNHMGPSPLTRRQTPNDRRHLYDFWSRAHDTRAEATGLMRDVGIAPLTIMHLSIDSLSACYECRGEERHSETHTNANERTGMPCRPRAEKPQQYGEDKPDKREHDGNGHLSLDNRSRKSTTLLTLSRRWWPVGDSQ